MALAVVLLFSMGVGFGIWAWLTLSAQKKRIDLRLDSLMIGARHGEQVLKSSQPTSQNHRIGETFLFLALPILAVFLWQKVAPGSMPFFSKFLLAIAVGLVLKILWKHRQIRLYRAGIEEALPVTLDLLVVCVEAGLSLTSSLIRVAEETRGTPLSNELVRTFNEINVGISLEKAFRNLARRTKVPDIDSLAGTIIESEKMGIGLGESLRNHSNVLRETIRMRTREKIQTLPIKMLFPLVFFILPSIFTVILGPAAIKIIQTFGKSSSGMT